MAVITKLRLHANQLSRHEAKVLSKEKRRANRLYRRRAKQAIRARKEINEKPCFTRWNWD